MAETGESWGQQIEGKVKAARIARANKRAVRLAEAVPKKAKPVTSILTHSADPKIDESLTGDTEQLYRQDE